MTSFSTISYDLSHNLCDAFGSIHRLYLFNSWGMGTILSTKVQNGLQRLYKNLAFPIFARSEQFGSFLPINSKLILSPKNFNSSWTFKQWDGSYIPLPWFWPFSKVSMNTKEVNIWLEKGTVLCWRYANIRLYFFWRLTDICPCGCVGAQLWLLVVNLCSYFMST